MSKQSKEAEIVHEREHEHDDDLIVVPKGQSKLKFYSTLALLIFVLLIFTVGPMFEQAAGGVFGGGGAKTVAVSWVHPQTGERIEYGDMEFVLAKRDLGLASTFGLYSSPSLREERGQLSDEDAAMFLIMERLAQDSGIGVGDEEVRDLLTRVFQDDQILAAQAQRFRKTPREIQDVVTRVMRVEKYKGLLLSGASIPEPARVEELWGEQHTEYSFEYVSMATEDFEAAAKAATPDDAELLIWFHEQPINVQRGYYTEQMYRASAAWLPFEGEFDETALLAAYPMGEDWDEDTEARNYYNDVVSVRFTEEVLPEEEESTEEESTEGEETTDETADSEEAAEETTEEETPQQPRIVTRTFEEVEEQARREARMRAALRAWLIDMRERTAAGEVEVDFAAEAAAVGLSFDGSEESRTRAQLQAAEGWGGPFVASSLAPATPGSFLSNVIVEDGGFVVARLDERLAPEEPPFEEIRGRVAVLWTEEQGRELAMEAAEAVYRGMAPAPEEDAEETTEEEVAEETAAEETTEEEVAAIEEDTLPEPFVITSEQLTAAATAAGQEVVQRPWLERFEIPDDDFDAASPATMHIRVTQDLFDLEPGQLARPQTNAARTHVFLIRYVDERSAPISKMEPADLMNLRRTASTEAVDAFEADYLTADSRYVRDTYQVQMAIWDQEPPLDAEPAQ